jgi:GH43 family beta-xylosidase
MKRFYSIYLILLPLVWFSTSSNKQVIAPQESKQFNNPMLPSGADPWTIYKDGFYYYTNTTGNRLEIWKTKNLVDLKTAERKVIWRPPSGTNHSKEIWAPELHFFNGK